MQPLKAAFFGGKMSPVQHFVNVVSAVFVYIVPFSISCVGRAVIAYVFLKLPMVRNLLL